MQSAFQQENSPGWQHTFFFCLIQKIHSWHGEMGEDTWSKVSWNIKKMIWGLLGRQDASHVTTVQQMQVSWGDSESRWRSLIKSDLCVSRKQRYRKVYIFHDLLLCL